MMTKQRQSEYIVLLCGALALIFTFALNITQGEVSINFAAILNAFFNTQKNLATDIILGFRLPRAIMGCIAGGALAVSGALTQSILRNPIVSPGLLGIHAGSFLFIVLAVIFAPLLMADHPFLISISGGLCAVLLVALIAGGRSAPPLRMLLSGLLVGMSLNGLTEALLILHEEQSRQIIGWNAGSLRQNGWDNLQLVWPWITVSLLLALLMAHQLDVARLGSDAARGLGQKTRLVSGIVFALILILSGITIAVTGPIGFVGLVVPHLVKQAGIRRHAIILPACILWGGSLLLAADTLTYQLGSLTDTPPVGAVTAMIGAPFLLWLVLHQSHGDRGVILSEGQTSRFSLPRITYAPLWLIAVFILSLIILLLIAGLAWVGGYSLSVSQLLQALHGAKGSIAERIVWNIRLPRLCNAFLVGAGFALAGTLFQAVLRNPLADSGVVGVSGGAAAASLLLLALVPAAPPYAIGLSALCGGLCAGGAIYAMAWHLGLSPGRLSIIGISVAALCGALTQILLIQSRFTGNPLIWLIGSPYGTSWSTTSLLAATLVVAFPCVWLIAERIGLLCLNDQSAHGLGLDVNTTRLLAGGIGITVASLCVSCTGPIGYVGLIAPHMARLLVGHLTRPNLLLAPLIGAALVGAADCLARVIIAPAELPTGAVIAMIGAPYLLYLTRRSLKA